MSRAGAVAGLLPQRRLDQSSRRALVVALALVFAASWLLTIAWATSMSNRSAIAMRGGSATPMASIEMSEPRPAVAAVSFVAMWTVMMVAMMLPSLAPTLWHYRRSVDRIGLPRPNRSVLLVGLGYFVVWIAIGVAVAVLGAVAVDGGISSRSFARAVPFAVGAVVAIAGAMQLTSWKTHHLARCRDAFTPVPSTLTNAASAWRHGLRLGVHCSLRCAGPTAIVLAAGIMDLRVMAIVTAAITAERLAPNGARIARVSGAVAIAVGLFIIVRAAVVA